MTIALAPNSGPAIAGPGEQDPLQVLPALINDASFLLVSLSNDFDNLMDQIIGAMQRHLKRVRKPDVIFEVTRVLMAHAGFHSNRVWCCRLTVVEILIQAKIEKCSDSTIKRCLSVLEKHGYIRTIKEPGELLAGPGPHRRPEELRESQYRTATRDLGGLMKLLRTVLIAAKTPIPVPGLDDPEKLADPFSDAPQNSLSKTTLLAPPGAPPNPGAPSEAEKVGSTSKVAINTVSNQTQRSQKAPKGRIFRVSNLDHLKETGVNADGSEQSKRYEEGGTQAQEVDGSASSQEASPSRAHASSAPSGRAKSPAKGITPEQQAMAEKLVRETKRPGEKGINPFVAQAYVRRFGVEWCTSLLVYGREKGVHDNETKGAGWYVETIKKWIKGEGEWPIWLRKRMRIEDDTAALAERSAQISRDATPVVSVETAAAEIREEQAAQAASDADLDALSDTEREELLGQALTEVLGGMKPMNPMKMFVKRDGIKHPMVRSRAKHLLVQQRESLLAEERALQRGYEENPVGAGAPRVSSGPRGSGADDNPDVPTGTARSP